MRARFIVSAVDKEGYPPPDRAEIALVGRSNVGKSSLLNALVQERVARTSKTPGRTQQLNFFDVTLPKASGSELGFRIADLPGYGFAAAPRSVQASWPKMIERYLSNRSCLRALLLLIDVRHEPQPADHEAVEWIKSLRRNFEVVLIGTKADRMPKAQRRLSLSRALRSLDLPESHGLLTSSVSGAGLDELRALLLAVTGAQALSAG